MNFALIVFAVLIMLTGCGRHEEKKAAGNASTNKPPSPAVQTNIPVLGIDKSLLDPRLQGTWVWDGDQAGTPRGGSLTFSPDGTYKARSTNQTSGGSNSVIFEGIWGVKDGILVFRYTKASDPYSISPHRMDQYRIVRVDDKDLALADMRRTETNVMHRRK
ncbi:MAG: hypothetical protein QOJ40_1810 [Verrucomicrobiota bacterium]